MRPLDPGRWLYGAINALVVLFLLLPIAIVAVFAVNPTPFIQFPPVGVSLRWFEKFFASRDFMQAIQLSLTVAAVVAVVATTLGATAALALARGRLPGAHSRCRLCDRHLNAPTPRPRESSASRATSRSSK